MSPTKAMAGDASRFCAEHDILLTDCYFSSQVFFIVQVHKTCMLDFKIKNDDRNACLSIWMTYRLPLRSQYPNLQQT